jgi:hypothetical protein
MGETMSVFGIVTLIQPAVFLLILGTSLCSLGCFWLLIGRKIQKKWLKIVSALVVWAGSYAIFAAGVVMKYGMAPISFEVIQGL